MTPFLSFIRTASVIGLDAHLVRVESDISPGLGAFVIVGLPDAAVQEARERVRSAMKRAKVDFPRTRITINLAPADLRKTGTPFDLPIALAILLAQGDIPAEDSIKRLFCGELGLDGSLRPIHGALSVALLARDIGIDELILPAENAFEAALVQTVAIKPARTLSEVLAHVRGQNTIETLTPREVMTPAQPLWSGPDFAAVRGQEHTRRALEIAAAGGHNIILQGPPGSGKTLIARTFPSILPGMDPEEALEATKIHSVAGLLPKEGVVQMRPFRAPHHSASMVSLVGGGSTPRPGEISLAHRGVLFLDEFLEFPRPVLESLRQPLEDGTVTVSRANGTVLFPARFTLVAALNPCPCGYLTDQDHRCICSPIQVIKYRKRLSGPLLDRIDMFIEVPKVKTEDLTYLGEAESSETIRTRVEAARRRQRERYKHKHLQTNAEISSDLARQLIKTTNSARTILKQAIERFHLSARGYFRLLKVSQTIADLASLEAVDASHVAEALQYRQAAEEGLEH